MRLKAHVLQWELDLFRHTVIVKKQEHVRVNTKKLICHECFTFTVMSDNEYSG